jgi:oligopeptide/dipeptide ABC transporter ATP-binding protein
MTPVATEPTRGLALRGLSIDIVGPGPSLRVVDRVDLSVAPGEFAGLVGESGSGKTLTSLAILDALPTAARIAEGSVTLDGVDITAVSSRGRRQINGRRVGIVFQEAKRSLDPVFTIGEQISEVARSHMGLGRKAAKQRAITMLDRAGISQAGSRVNDYPTQLSGGLAQRAMIAKALVCEPDYLIADEPTTALDVTIQAQILRLLRELQSELNLGVLLITHDLAVVAETCDRLTVMYAGQVVEAGDVTAAYERPAHPYLSGLLEAVPLDHRRDGSFLAIPGVVPAPDDWPSGCRFHPRCAWAQPGRCDGDTPKLARTGERAVRCVRAGELELRGVHDVLG